MAPEYCTSQANMRHLTVFIACWLRSLRSRLTSIRHVVISRSSEPSPFHERNAFSRSMTFVGFHSGNILLSNWSGDPTIPLPVSIWRNRNERRSFGFFAYASASAERGLYVMSIVFPVSDSTVLIIWLKDCAPYLI